MNRSGLFGLGLAAGAAVGAAAMALVLQGAAGTASEGAVSTVDRAERADGPVLDARPAATGPGDLPARRGAGTPAADAGAAERFEAWYADSVQRLPDPKRALRAFWLGLAVAYATAGRAQDLQRACDGALQAGVPPAELLAALRGPGISPSLKGLMARHPDAGWDVRTRLQAADADDPAPLLEALRAVRASLQAAAANPALPPLPDGQLGLVELLQRLGQIDPAKAVWEAEAIAGAVDDPVVLRELAEGVRADPAAALRLLGRALERSPLDARSLSLCMDLDLARATAHLESVVAQDPTSVRAWSALGDAHERAENPAGAVAARARAAELDPSLENLEALALLDPATGLQRLVLATQGPAANDPDVWALRARTEVRSGSPTAALESWLHVVQLRPALAMDDDLPGWLALDPKRVADALAPSVERAFATVDDDVLVPYAAALVASKDARAFAVCRRAVEKGVWWLGLPSLLARADPAAALPLLEARREARGADLDVLRGLGEAYLGLGRQADATTAFEAALANAEAAGWWVPELWVGLARCDPVAGLDRVRATAKTLDSAQGEALVGDALAALGRTADARAAYDRAIEKEPDRALWRARRAALR